MARILAVSSFLAHGRIGLMANAAAIQALGHEVLQFPTILLSNHPGYAHAAGERVSCVLLMKMLDAMEANGWLGDICAVLTGYLPTASHVAFAHEALKRVRRHSPAALYVCDPIIGDDPKGLYIDQLAAEAIRDRLVPVADVLTPNRFEISWLTGRAVDDPASTASAVAHLACQAVAATSIPQGANEILNVLVADGVIRTLASSRRARVPHGTGDVFCGLLTGLLATGLSLPDAFVKADRVLQEVVTLSSGRQDLDLAPLMHIA